MLKIESIRQRGDEQLLNYLLTPNLARSSASARARNVVSESNRDRDRNSMFRSNTRQIHVFDSGNTN